VTFDEAELESRLVWILGSPRSGTTWVTQLLIYPWRFADDAPTGLRDPRPGRLLTPPTVIPVNEPLLSQHLAPPRPPPPDTAGQSAPSEWSINSVHKGRPSYVLSDEYAPDWRPHLRSFILHRLHAHVERAREELGAKRPLVAVKEPQAAFAAELLMSLLPRSRMVLVLRDGRDVIDSLLDAHLPGGFLETFGYQTVSDPESRLRFVVEQAHEWRARMQALEEAWEGHAADLRAKVRYEELRADPLPVLTGLVRWLGLERGDEELAAAVQDTDFESLPAEHKGRGQFHRAAQPGLWRSNMTMDEQRAMNEIITPTLSELGYEAG
jgi:hypothetical protein